MLSGKKVAIGLYRHKTKQGIIVIAPHKMNDDIPKGTENSILK